MAFSGLHVVCGFAGSLFARDKSQAILGKIAWTAAPATGVTTTLAAPDANDGAGQPLFRIRAAADSYVSIGANPNSAADPRFLVAAGTDYDVYVQPGDKLQWVAA